MIVDNEKRNTDQIYPVQHEANSDIPFENTFITNLFENEPFLKTVTSIPTQRPINPLDKLQIYDSGSTKTLYFYCSDNSTWYASGGSGSTAIAYDTSTACTASGGSTQTTSHTVTGTNPVLFVGIVGNQGDAPTAVSYAGIPMTLINSTTSSGNWILYLYYLRGPATGSNSVSITMSGSHGDFALAVSYTGASQITQPNASSVGGPTTTTSYSQSVTTTVNNCWTMMMGYYSGSLNPASGTATVVRLTTGSTMFICDSATPQVIAGSNTLNVTSSSQTFTGVMASITPA